MKTPASTAATCREFGAATQASRRTVLSAGFAGLLGLGGLPLLARAAGDTQAAGFGRAKRCIFLFMWGGPSQLDTFDMKPQAPDSVRGPFKPVATKVPGLQICEHFQKLPAIMDKLAVIRSLGHDDPAHLSSAHATVTGQLAPVLKSDKDPPSSKDSPHLGSLMSKLLPSQAALPQFVMLPWKAYHPAAPGGQAPGQHGGWLGSNFDPLLVSGDPNDAAWKVPALQLQAGVTPQLLENRFTLLRELEAQRQAFDTAAVAERLSQQQQQALGLLASTKVRDAFDLSQESAATRDRYGRHIHGQCVLLARRLVEQGVPVVNVNWHNDGQTFWDTHSNNFERLKKDLIPPADQALTALLTDLEERGMLEDTIVAWVGEFGRRPETTNGTGREHWPYCYSGLLAGGGIAGGAVYGASDAQAAYPTSNLVTPQDYMATILHSLGVRHDQTLAQADGRPHAVYGGKPILPLFS